MRNVPVESGITSLGAPPTDILLTSSVCGLNPASLITWFPSTSRTAVSMVTVSVTLCHLASLIATEDWRLLGLVADCFLYSARPSVT